MFTLAEIADKMPTVAGMWLTVGALSLPLVMAALAHRWVAVGALLGASALAACVVWIAYAQAYLEGSFSEMVWSEMGGGWVAHSFAVGVLPVVLVGAAAIVRWRAAGSRDVP